MTIPRRIRGAGPLGSVKRIAPYLHSRPINFQMEVGLNLKGVFY
jgi:hypothetical protein